MTDRAYLHAFFLTLPLTLAVACSNPAAQTCTPGVSVACVGPGGCAGGQICNAAGNGYGACDCGGMTDSGMTDGGGPGDGGPGDGGPGDGGPGDGGPGDDTGPTSCDPRTQAGCSASERCAWVNLGSGVGEARCVPNGTGALSDPCTVGPDGDMGYDDCSRGLVCIGGACATVCEIASDAGCSSTQDCVAYSGLFASGSDTPTVGACVSTCDPVTQMRPDGSTCGAGMGCYVLISSTAASFLCAHAGTVAVGDDIAGTPFANSCVPGAMPAMHAAGGAYCTPLCRPVPTSSSAPSGAAGMSPYACSDLGAGAPNECIYAWLLSPMATPDARLSTFGFCFDPTGRMIDTDHDGMPDAPWPSCTTLAPTDTDGDGTADNQAFGCAPLP